MICNKCGKEKTKEQMAHKVNYCKECDAKRAKAYRKTPKGLISQIYNDQVKTCKKRGRELPKYTQKELYDWIISQPNFNQLMTEWKRSGYNRKLVPSIDRLDSLKTYSFDNIQLVTFEENEKQALIDRKSGKDFRQARIVGKIKDKEIVKIYHSVNAAARDNNCMAGHISEVAYGKRKQAGGFNWVFLSGIDHKNAMIPMRAKEAA